MAHLSAAVLAIAVVQVAAYCEFLNRQVKVDKGSWSELCCLGMDGSKDVAYYAQFRSMSNDAYATAAVVADDSAQIGKCAGGASGGPADWKTYEKEFHSDSFDHTEHFYMDGSGGTFIRTQLNFRVYCTQPGIGSQCQVQIEKLQLCNRGGCPGTGSAEAKHPSGFVNETRPGAGMAQANGGGDLLV